ncbi:hypothetical protein GCM10027270_11130 [Nocardioides ginkgobilobae]
MSTTSVVAPGPPASELCEEEVLVRAGAWARLAQRAGAQLLVLAYEWAVAHPADRLDPQQAGKPGRERATLIGGPGTPVVTEFAAAEFGARIGRTTHGGRKVMAAALDLKLRLPLLWARVQALEVRDSYAIHVAERTRDLTVEQAGWVDAEVVEAADGRIPWTHFEDLVAGKVAAAAPEVAKEKERRAAEATFARALKRRAGEETSGMATFMIRGPVPVIDALDHAVTTLAHRLQAHLSDRSPAPSGPEDTGPTMDQLRVQAVAILAAGHAGQATGHDDPDDRGSHAGSHAGSGATGGESVGTPGDGPGADLGTLDLRDLLPAVSLVVHVYGGPREVTAEGEELDRIARVEGHGPVSETWLREVLGRYARFDVRPVLHPEGLAPVESYEVPARHRRAVQLLAPTETFPWGTTASTGPTVQLDHVVPWDPDGPPDSDPRPQTGLHNLAPLSTLHHRLKTHGGWQSAMPWPGIQLWRDPHGQVYLRDTTGTRQVTEASAAPLQEEPRHRVIAIDFYEPPFRLEYDAA